MKTIKYKGQIYQRVDTKIPSSVISKISKIQGIIRDAEGVLHKSGSYETDNELKHALSVLNTLKEQTHKAINQLSNI